MDSESPVIGIVTDPDSPTAIGATLTDGLADWLEERTGDRWDVEVVTDPAAAAAHGSTELLQTVARNREQRGWRYAICVTDLPLLLDDRPAMAEWNDRWGAAVVSLPAHGLRVQHGLRRTISLLLGELIAGETLPAGHHRLSPVTLARTDDEGRLSDEGAAGRYSLSPVRGWLRLVLGMVRANRPWKLVFGLSSALAAALATSAFGLSSTTIWQIGDQLPALRRVLASLLAVTVLVSWLIVAHRLWERSGKREQGFRRLAVLYNLATVLTLVCGVLMLYAGLLLMNLTVAWFVLPENLIISNLGHPPDLATYLGIAWGFTNMGVLAGAVGSSLEDDETVRQVAYGHREQYRLRSIEPEGS